MEQIHGSLSIIHKPWTHCMSLDTLKRIARQTVQRPSEQQRTDWMESASGIKCHQKSQVCALCSVLLVPVRVMDELPMQLLGLLGIEPLTAFWALKGSTHLDADIVHSAVTRLCRV